MKYADFEAQRPRLLAIAGRILGSSADADDVVQEAWLRLSTAEGVEDLPAWLTTVTTRLCLDHLRRRGTRVAAEARAVAEAPGPAAVATPEDDVAIAERVGDAMDVMLQALGPAERASFVLHDVFGYGFHEISVIMGRSDTTVRQLASRARRKVRGVPETLADRNNRADNARLVEAFLDAAHGGDLSTLLTLLAPDAVMRTDLFGQRMGAEAEYDGAAAVAARFNAAQGASPVTIDGERGGAWIVRGKVKAAFVFHIEDGRVREVELLADPDVLKTMELVADAA
ncbi:sigma-70 family RNA polymerase sigma factor [Gryllotalpicola koreensis]|uniref:Sigma-70 family RNA polymerase sigma factor n=1 Tax=Gryllotalpicola koreensis TaxID=993086 RepID=A0ABP7ZQE9_9MICO